MATEEQSDLDKSSKAPFNQAKLENTEFNNVDEVRELIRKLQMVAQDMEKKTTPAATGPNANNGVETVGAGFETLPLIDLDGLKFESEENWLLDTSKTKTSSNTESVFLDSHLLSIRHDLLNKVKQALDEDRMNQMNVRLKRNTSYLVRRESDSQEVNLPYYSSPSRDVTGSYTYRVPKSRSSPARASIFAQQQDHANETSSPDMPSPILCSPLNQTAPPQEPSPPIHKYATVTRSAKLETTFTTSPVHADNHEGKGQGHHELNVTFLRSSEDEAISSPSGSGHSPRNNSMEELQSRARQQEQRLRETPIRRKDTHVINYHDINEAKIKLATRTSSADTYSLGDSNPDSGASSGVSSPRDSQSYENVHLVPNSVRRSMPNLVHLKEAQRGRGSGLQVINTTGQMRKQSRYTSDPRLSAQQSAAGDLSARRDPASYSANGRQTNVNKNQIPIYTRGDTFYKSRPQVLSIPPMDQLQGGQSFVGNVQKTDQCRLVRSHDQPHPTDVGYENRSATKNMSNGHQLSFVRHSATTGGNFRGEAEKPKSRIPAPGSRLKHF